MKKKKQQGKKKFESFFRRRFLICLPVSVLILYWLFVRPELEENYYYKGEGIPNRSYDNEGLENTFQKLESLGYSIPDFFALYFSYKYVYEELAAVFYQPETGEFYVSTPYALASVWQNGEEQTYRLDDRQLIDRLDGSMNFYYKENLIVYSIYVRDDKFIPGDVYIQKDTTLPFPRYWKEGRTIPGEWVDLSPADTEGWTKLCSDRSKEYLSSYHDNYLGDRKTGENAKTLSTDGKLHLGDIKVCGSANSPHADRLIEAFKEKIPKKYKTMIAEQQKELEKAARGEITQEDLDQYRATNRAELIKAIRASDKKARRKIPMEIYSELRSEGCFDDDRGIIRLMRQHYGTHTELITYHDEKCVVFYFWYMDQSKALRCDVFRYWMYILPAVLIPALIAALLWSVIAYLLYSRRYDMETYRKNLTGALAHDLKTPLAVIYGNAENIRAHTHPENTDEYADFIMENVTHIDEMIAGVLDLSKLERGAAPSMKETVDLTSLLHTAFQRNASAMERRGLTLTESGQFTVRGNPEMLAQLAENLAVNAVQHTAEGGEITVTAEKRMLRISNPYTGELDEKTLCEPFKRGDAARGSQSGSGLGLSIVQQIAALHQLRLRVTARNGVFTAALKLKRFR